MKTKCFLIATLTLLFVNTNPMQAQTSLKGKKILVAYYSWGGNTRNMAEQIKAITNADIFEIVPASPYPEVYQEVVDQAKAEINRNHKPALKNKISNINEYDIVIVGSPNWWATIAPPVATFLSDNNLSGKIIVPFITHEGSRMGRSEQDIKELCPNATMLKGLPVRGGNVSNAKNDITKWLTDLGIIE